MTGTRGNIHCLNSRNDTANRCWAVTNKLTHSLIITRTKVLVHCALGAMVVVAWLDKHNLRMLN